MTVTNKPCKILPVNYNLHHPRDHNNFIDVKKQCNYFLFFLDVEFDSLFPKAITHSFRYHHICASFWEKRLMVPSWLGLDQA